MIKETQKDTIEEHIQTLPKVVQNAIVSGDVTKKLRGLAKKHKLHLDQWDVLEDEIMFTLIGLSDPDRMAENVAKEVGISIDAAQAIVNDVAVEVFDPIRDELEKGLSHTNPEPLHNREAKLPKEEPQEFPKPDINKTEPSDSPKKEVSSVRTTIEHDPYREAIE